MTTDTEGCGMSVILELQDRDHFNQRRRHGCPHLLSDVADVLLRLCDVDMPDKLDEVQGAVDKLSARMPQATGRCPCMRCNGLSFRRTT